MADIHIETSQTEQTVGGILTGNVLISSKFHFIYSQILLTLRIREVTRVEDYPSGTTATKFIYKETHLVYNREYQIAEEGEVRNETQRVPFSIRLPPECPPTFQGSMCDVEYMLEVKILSNRSPLHKYETKIIARERLEEIAPRPVLKEGDMFSVHFDTDTFCISKPLKGKLILLEDLHFNGVSFEIWNTEEAFADNHKSIKTNPTLKGYLESDRIKRDNWTEFEFDLDSSIPVSTMGSNFQSSNELHVKLDATFHLDEDIRIPINLVYCYGARHTSVDFDDLV
ncbi:MAG: hypothetical protein ACFFF4_07125 [Candidatus Thorarchaeota archaeon]